MFELDLNETLEQLYDRIHANLNKYGKFYEVFTNDRYYGWTGRTGLLCLPAIDSWGNGSILEGMSMWNVPVETGGWFLDDKRNRYVIVKSNLIKKDDKPLCYKFEYRTPRINDDTEEVKCKILRTDEPERQKLGWKIFDTKKGYWKSIIEEFVEKIVEDFECPGKYLDWDCDCDITKEEVKKCWQEYFEGKFKEEMKQKLTMARWDDKGNVVYNKEVELDIED